MGGTHHDIGWAFSALYFKSEYAPFALWDADLEPQSKIEKKVHSSVDKKVFSWKIRRCLFWCKTPCGMQNNIISQICDTYDRTTTTSLITIVIFVFC